MRSARRSTPPVLVAEEIKRDILHQSLKAGQRLPTENELTKQLGVGRPTVRETLRTLEGQGWLSLDLAEELT